MRIQENDKCFASKARQTIIDTLHPATGLTVCYGKTLEQCKAEYPDAEELTVDDFCSWKAEQQHAPIVWGESTQDKFDEMLGVLPPAAMFGGGFLVGEPWDHDAGTGEPRFQAYRQRGDKFEVASRPMTRREFRKEMG